MCGGISINIFNVLKCQIIKINRKVIINCDIMSRGLSIIILTILERPLYGVIPWDAT
jgi:hypothetical protein